LEKEKKMREHFKLQIKLQIKYFIKYFKKLFPKIWKEIAICPECDEVIIDIPYPYSCPKCGWEKSYFKEKVISIKWLIAIIVIISLISFLILVFIKRWL
jgi:rubrerythrin